MRAGHTEAGCDLAGMAGLTPTSVICEIMKDDGSMARLPDLELFAAEHGLKIGTIADLIEHRSRHETLITRTLPSASLATAQGEFDCQVFSDRTGATHLALSHGAWQPGDEVLVRVHEPLSMLDLLETGNCGHSWSLPAALDRTQSQPCRRGRTAELRRRARLALLGRMQPAANASRLAWRTQGRDGPAHLWHRRTNTQEPWACSACAFWAARAACPAWPAMAWK